MEWVLRPSFTTLKTTLFTSGLLILLGNLIVLLSHSDGKEEAVLEGRGPMYYVLN